MKAGRVTLQLARILVLLFLLRATGWYINAIHNGSRRLQVDELLAPWTAVSVVCVLFVIAMLVGRHHRHPWAVLAIEAVLAAVLAFVPPLQWVLWFGINGWSNAMGGGFVQPLAVAWLGVVILRGFHQLRDGAVPDPRPTDGSTAETSDNKGTRVISA